MTFEIESERKGSPILSYFKRIVKLSEQTGTFNDFENVKEVSVTTVRSREVVIYIKAIYCKVTEKLLNVIQVSFDVLISDEVLYNW